MTSTGEQQAANGEQQPPAEGQEQQPQDGEQVMRMSPQGSRAWGLSALPVQPCPI